jgi:putative FmdB family regulatory protein
MPTYDYKCNACSHTFEQFQSMKDKPLKKCPACGKSALERLIGIGAAVIFKGSGFYQTDYRSESYKKSAESDKPAEPPKTETKAAADAKPASDAKPTAEAKPAPTTEKAAPVQADAKPSAAKGAKKSSKKR